MAKEGQFTLAHSPVTRNFAFHCLVTPVNRDEDRSINYEGIFVVTDHYSCVLRCPAFE